MDKLSKVLEWHEDWTYKWIERFGMTEYHAMWAAFGKGVVLVLLLQWIF